MSNLDPFKTPVIAAFVTETTKPPTLIVETPGGTLPSDIPQEFVDAINNALDGFGSDVVIDLGDVTRVDEHTFTVDLPVPLGIINWELALPVVPDPYDFFMTGAFNEESADRSFQVNFTAPELQVDRGDGVYQTYTYAATGGLVSGQALGNTLRARCNGIVHVGVGGSFNMIDVFSARELRSFTCEGMLDLQRVSLPALPECTSLFRAFAGCSQLVEGPRVLPQKECHMGSLFEGCHRLAIVPSIDTRLASNVDRAFIGCYWLQHPNPYPLGASDLDALLSPGGALYTGGEGASYTPPDNTLAFYYSYTFFPNSIHRLDQALVEPSAFSPAANVLSIDSARFLWSGTEVSDLSMSLITEEGVLIRQWISESFLFLARSPNSPNPLNIPKDLKLFEWDPTGSYVGPTPAEFIATSPHTQTRQLLVLEVTREP